MSTITWNTANNAGTATIGDKISLSLATNQQASELYIADDHPFAVRDITEFTSGECSFVITARIVECNLNDDSRLCFALFDSEASSGITTYIHRVGSYGIGQWDNSGDAGTADGACPLDGTGWIRIICLAGAVSIACGAGTEDKWPTRWHTATPGRARGSKPFDLFAVYLVKWSTGGPASASVDNVTIESFKLFS